MRRRWRIVTGALAGLGVLAVFAMLFAAGHRAPKMMPRAELLAQAEPQAISEAASPALTREIGDQTAPPVPGGIIVSVPQLAYSYTLGYRLPVAMIAPAQQAHLDLCMRLGAARCQLVSLQRGGGEDGSGEASLKLRIASTLAQRFSADLGRTVVAVGGRAVEASVGAEDVSKQVVDTDARIRQREILVARLTDMLRNRQGKVGELVEAERSVAQAQEELDQAKAWLRELRGRVAFAEFSIRYLPVTAPAATPQHFGGRIGDAVVQSGNVVAVVGQGLLMLAIFLAPWALLAMPVVLLVRRRRAEVAALS